jgi:hypothetical protein
MKTVSILLQALDHLTSTGPVEPEDELNRKLYFLLLEANRTALTSSLGAFDCAPVYEGSNLPSADDIIRANRESKRPDFQWTCIDHTAPDPKHGVRAFVIECKRLGAPLRTDWEFNVNYVTNGIARFVNKEHGYACDDYKGAMVGYVQSMEFEDILSEVNSTSASMGIPLLSEPADGWKENGTSLLTHTLTRAFGATPFHLLHFWVDLRTRINPSPVRSNGEEVATAETGFPTP